MIDFFGRKARAEREALQREFNDLANRHMRLIDENHNADSRIRELADIIREYDQGIFQMAQKTTWADMRPIFNKLQVGQESRMKAESNRINDILKHELIEVYRK